MVVLAIIALIALYYALRSPRDMEEQHGRAVDTPAARAGLMGGTCAVMGGVGVLVVAALLAALWAAAAVVI